MLSLCLLPEPGTQDGVTYEGYSILGHGAVLLFAFYRRFTGVFSFIV
jgi:hypothetical protein